MTPFVISTGERRGKIKHIRRTKGKGEEIKVCRTLFVLDLYSQGLVQDHKR